MSDDWMRDVLIQTISGIVSGSIVVLAQKGLEKRIKNLEEKEKQKAEINDHLKLRSTLVIFKKMHIKNSKKSDKDFKGEWYEIIPNGEHDKEYDSAFKLVQKNLSKLLGKISKNDNENSFIVVCTHRKNMTSPSDKPIQHEYLSWGEYKKNVEKSRNYFKYFENLRKDNSEKERCCEVLFSMEKIQDFCSKIIAEIL